MMKIFENVDQMEKVAQRLDQIQFIAKYNDHNEKEAWTLVYGFHDLERSFRELLDNYFPKLFNTQMDDEAYNDLLSDIGEEIKHIYYHINDSKYIKHFL